MPYERNVEIPVRGAEGVMIRFSSSGRPIHRYAVILLAYRDGGWREVRVFDNHLGEHHQHR